MRIQFDASLQDLNTMAVPATAKSLVSVSDLDDLRAALKYAREESLGVLVLGEGSNTVFTQDFPGLIILNRLMGMQLVEDSQESVSIKVSSGENWHQIVEATLENNWFGLENLALIPGLVGAAPIQNIGAYGVELKDHLIDVEYMDISSGDTRLLKCAECRFAYRDSVFKHELAGKTVITAITLKLSKSANPVLNYPALVQKINSMSVPDSALIENSLASSNVMELPSSAVNPSARQVFDAVCAIRRAKLPMPSELPNTGSFFKNPIISKEHYLRLHEKYPDIVSYKLGPEHKLAAAWLIEKAGWKDKEIEGVRVHRDQALVITNPLKASGKAVYRYAHAIKDSVEELFGVALEIEPQLI